MGLAEEEPTSASEELLPPKLTAMSVPTPAAAGIAFLHTTCQSDEWQAHFAQACWPCLTAALRFFKWATHVKG